MTRAILPENRKSISRRNVTFPSLSRLFFYSSRGAYRHVYKLPSASCCGSISVIPLRREGGREKKRDERDADRRAHLHYIVMSLARLMNGCRCAIGTACSLTSPQLGWRPGVIRWRVMEKRRLRDDVCLVFIPERSFPLFDSASPHVSFCSAPLALSCITATVPH